MSVTKDTRPEGNVCECVSSSEKAFCQRLKTLDREISVFSGLPVGLGDKSVFRC